MSRSGGTRAQRGWPGTEPRSVTRRKVLREALALTVMGVLPAAFSSTVRAQGAGGGIVNAALPARQGPRPGTWLVLLGTRGGPGIDPARAQTASAVVVD